ncbi:hypothetical protein L3Q82_002291 [Scortum barcoo]|uniref:Uncharacterized protein n=1 Tax=Scortum barcoo TaxID=214431 RepID=A0ACB8VXW8_9TELE|nr:hypothetical protein L3Q82_002291 [Scortum barcoo]
MMASYVMVPFIILALLGSARANSEVMKSSKAYPCCDSPAIKFNQLCENIWSNNNEPIAISKGSSKQCVSPCKKIENGLMTLDGCPPLNTTVVCTNANSVVEEQRIEYYSQPCSASPSAQTHASVGLLLAVLIGGSMMMMKETIC